MNTVYSHIDVSIVIPARNEAAYLPACLDAIAAQQTDLSIEVIVVDNGSTDSTAAIARERGVCVVSESTSGVGRARRTGTAIATGDFVLHIDADSRLPQTYVQAAYETFQKNPDLVCLGGRMYWYDAPRWLKVFGYGAQSILVPTIRFFSRGSLGPLGNNMMFRRDVYNKCRGFDPQLQFGEEGDLTKQLRRHGQVDVDLSLVCNTSARRIKFRREFLIYAINVLYSFFGKHPFRNQLPPVDRKHKNG